MIKATLQINLLFTTLALWPSEASAFSLDDVVRYHPTVWALRATAKSVIGKGVVDPCVEKVRTETEILIENKINPMLDRVDYILNHNIADAADLAMELLKQCDAILRGALHEVDEILERRIKQVDKAIDGRIQQIDKVIEERIDQIFLKLNSEASNLLELTDVKLSGLVDKAACVFAPNGTGFQVSVSILPSYNEARVWFPADSICWRTFLKSDEHPVSRVFSGWQFYQGLICEKEYSINGIHLDDPLGMDRLIESYSLLYALAQKAHCEIKLPETQRLLIGRQAEWARRVQFYRSLSGAQQRKMR